MINFFSYFPILFSLSLSFILHAIFNFKKHIHSFFGNANTITDSNNNRTNNDERIVDLDDQIDGGEDVDECWRTEERKGNWKKAEMSFPPPLSSLDGNGQPSFILLPVRKNGRLQLSKVRIKRPEIIHATRQDGRLRLYLVPDQCLLDDYEDDDDVEQQECEAEDEVVEDEEIVEVESEEEMFEDEMSRYEYEEEDDDRVREWKGGDNERFRRCYELVNHIHCINHVHSQHNLHMFGLSIA